MNLSSDPDIIADKQHQVTLNVSILQAVESSDKDSCYRESVRDGERKRIYESPTPSHYFHIEYRLLPGKNAQVFKTDVVTFGNVVAKVYTDRDNRVVQCWSEEDEGERETGQMKLNHYGWRHKHTFKVNKAQLLELYDHILEVRVWNSKSKLSARAKYDRPKAFRIPIRSPRKDDTDLELGVQGISKRPSKFAVVSHDQVRRMKGNRRQSKQIGSSLNIPRTVVPNMSTQNIIEGEESNASMDPISPRSANQEGMIQEEEGCASERSKLNMNIHKASSASSSHQLVPASSSVVESSSFDSTGSQGSSRQRQVQSQRRLRRLEAEAAEQARVDRDGIAVVRLKFLDLFGKKGCTNKQMKSSVKDLKHFELSVSVADSLLTEELSRELNPMMVTVVKATGLPSLPVPHEKLQERCDPAFAKYQFHTQPPHCTQGIPQSHEAVWNDTHVILLGTIDCQLLVEYLRGPPLVVEVHDRTKLQEESSVAALFGEENRDDVLGTHAFTAGMSHSTVAVHGSEETWSPYGIAKLDLSGLLQGQRLLELNVPVTGGPRCPFDCSGGETSLLQRSQPLPPGDYIGSQCQLKVIVEVSHPLFLDSTSTSPASSLKPSPVRNRDLERAQSKILTTPEHVRAATRVKLVSTPDKPRDACPFNRLIYIISSNGLSLVQKLITKVNQINSKALALDELPEKILCAALSTYKLTREQMNSSDWDVLTGFHVEDWEQHVIVLEGLKSGGLKKIWEDMPHHSTEDETIQKVLYNSEFEFSQRLYATLDVDLPKIKLYQPLTELTQQSLVYVKDSIPQKCFRALLSLSELSYANEMSDVTRNNLFPKADQLTALSLQFALPATANIGDNGSASTTIDRPKTPALLQTSSKKREWEPLELTNPQFERHIRERREMPAVDFITANMLHSMALSELSASQKPERSTRQRSLSESTPVHNYSSQTFNSIKLAQAKLKERLSTDPTHRYTYCQQYHSMTVVPIDVEAERRAQRLDACRKWRTTEGFTCPGVLSAKNSYSHPKHPDLCRVESLKEPFEDNVLHANTMKPTVERLDFDWNSRSNDFEKWKRPPNAFGPPLPATIHLAGESRAKELQESLDTEQREWTRKLVVNNPRFQPHRRGVRTELADTGPKASTQLDKLCGLLKDPPQKHSLQQGGLTVHDIPALNVVHNPSVDSRLNIINVVSPSEGELDGSKRGYVPGPSEIKSLKLDNNVIPLTESRGHSCRQDQPHPQEFRLYYHIPTVPANGLSQTVLQSP